MCSRLTSVDPNAFLMCSIVFSLDACRSKCVSCMFKCALARRPCIQMRFPCAQKCSRLTPVDRNAFLMCSNPLSLDACRSKCVSYVFKCALARRLSIQMRFLCGQVCSRSTPVNPNAFPMCSNALSLDACRFKCVSYVLTCALARRLPIDMRCLCVQMCSRSTPADPNAFLMCSNVLSLGACRSFGRAKANDLSQPGDPRNFQNSSKLIQHYLHDLITS